MSYIFRPSLTASTATDPSLSAISQWSWATGSLSLNAVSVRLVRASSFLASLTSAHCPRIQGMNSNWATFSLPGASFP